MFIDGKTHNMPKVSKLCAEKCACLSIWIFFAWFTQICFTLKVML